MLAVRLPRYPRLLTGGLAAALGLGAGAWAQAPGPVANGYVCLSNGCAAQAQVAAPARPAQGAAPAAGTRPPPLSASGVRTVEELRAVMLAGLTEEQRATGSVQVTETVDGDTVTLTGEYQGANGDRASRGVRFRRD